MDSHADTMVKRVFTAMNSRDPNSDPGDLTITVQDDSPLVEVWLDGHRDRMWLSVGSSIHEALERAAEGLESDVELPGEDNAFRGVLTPMFGPHDEGVLPHHEE